MHRTSTKAVISWIVLAAFISITQPSKLPVWGLIIPFFFLYFSIHYTVKLALERKGRVSLRVRAVEKWLPVVGALSVVLVLALQSIGQLTVRDIIAVVVVALLGYFYIHRNSSNRNNNK